MNSCRHINFLGLTFNAIVCVIFLYPHVSADEVITHYENSLISDDVVDSSTLYGKIMAGYQGWFSTPDDGGRNEWRHWTKKRQTPDREKIRVAMWPDLHEYDAEELYPTELKYNDNTNASLYSSHNPITVDRHVRWMQDYGIDGVFVQRFVNEITKGLRGIRDEVLQHVRHGAEKYGRVFANMYDISSANNATLVEDIKKDWMHLVDHLHVTESSRYLYHKGLPVVSIWGFGLKNRPGHPAQLIALADWFHNSPEVRYRAIVMGGVPKRWSHRPPPKNVSMTRWYNAYRALDIISPWIVGRIKNLGGVARFRNKFWESDLEECEKHGIDYFPVVYPGFSYHNHAKHEKPFNEVPRLGGRMYWHQFHHVIESGAKMVYVAMFDEVDEGTAIYKLAEDSNQSPISDGGFINLDEDKEEIVQRKRRRRRRVVPCDWYLTLTGKATQYLRSGEPFPEKMPKLPKHGCKYDEKVVETQ